jgi:protein-disulfide isomerase
MKYRLLPFFISFAAFALLLAPAKAADETRQHEMCDPNNPDSAACLPMSKAEQADVELGNRVIRPEDLPVDAIRQIVRDYLVEHPEVLLEAQQVLMERRRQQASNQARNAISANAQELYHDREAPVGGNPNGRIMLVEFFDYRCSHCRRAKPMLDQVLNDNDDVRIIYKEFPILGEDSVRAAKAALAARNQGKYFALHDALMAASGTFTRARIMEIAAKAGLDTTRLSEDMDDPAIIATLQRNRRLANALGVEGTPNFVLMDELIRGAPNQSQFQALIADARSALNN